MQNKQICCAAAPNTHFPSVPEPPLHYHSVPPSPKTHTCTHASVALFHPGSSQPLPHQDWTNHYKRTGSPLTPSLPSRRGLYLPLQPTRTGTSSARSLAPSHLFHPGGKIEPRATNEGQRATSGSFPPREMNCVSVTPFSFYTNTLSVLRRCDGPC